jgi:hypothetical protein
LIETLACQCLFFAETQQVGGDHARVAGSADQFDRVGAAVDSKFGQPEPRTVAAAKCSQFGAEAGSGAERLLAKNVDQPLLGKQC